MDLLFLSLALYLFASGVVSVVALWTNHDYQRRREGEANGGGLTEGGKS